jgi:MYXO-CTERM domain-containing protein
MKQRDTFPIKIAAFMVALLTSGSAMASTFSGVVAVGYVDNQFQISEGTSAIMINISATGARDPALCATCNSSYTDNYIVNLFDQAGTLLKSVNEINTFSFNMFGSSHGIGAGPVGVAVPAGATKLEIVSQLSISGLLGPDGHPLSFGNLNISTDGSITAATPIPSTLPLLATGLAALGLFGWHRRRKAPGLAAA